MHLTRHSTGTRYRAINSNVKCMKRAIKRGAISVAAIFIAVVAVWYMLNVFEYSLRATIKGDGSIQIQTLSLGEYYTPVTRFEIYESDTAMKVLTLVAKTENSRMHTVTLRNGINLFNDVYLDGYMVKYKDNKTYIFQSDVRYIVKVKWGMYAKEVSFVLPKST